MFEPPLAYDGDSGLGGGGFFRVVSDPLSTASSISELHRCNSVMPVEGGSGLRLGGRVVNFPLRYE